MEFDLIIRNGTIVDGTGRSRFRADLGLFDPATIANRTTRDRPDVPPAGIRAVLLAGQIVAEEGRLLPGPRRGRVLRR